MSCAIVASSAAILSYAATQLTERSTAQAFLNGVVRSLLEIDQYVSQSWPQLESLAANDEPIPLEGYPLPLQLDPSALLEGPERVSDSIALASAALIYDDGFSTIADSPQQFRLISRASAFDGTIGRLTDGGRQVATVALLISGVLAGLLLIATASQARGLARIAMPTLAVALAAAATWLITSWLQAEFERRADLTSDEFTTDLWLIGADAISLAIRDAAIIGIAGGGILLLAAMGAALLQSMAARP